MTNVLETQEKLAMVFAGWSEAYAEEFSHRRKLLDLVKLLPILTVP